MSRDDNYSVLTGYFCWFSTVYVLCKILYKLWTLADLYLLPNFRKQIDFKRYGQWAVITGSTDGIGKGFAEELASKGVDICLISRNEDKLKNTARHIEERYNVKTKYIVADFTDPNIYSNIRENLKGLDIGILVNNVGMVHSGAELFKEHSEEMIKNYVNVNILLTMVMTSVVLPHMIPQKKGLVINLSSFFGEDCYPYVSMYSSTKNCVKHFSNIIAYELKEHNVNVKTLSPGYVETNMAYQYRKSVQYLSQLPYNVATVSTYVKSALNAVNASTDSSSGYLPHEISLMLSKCLPIPVVAVIIKFLFEIKV